MTLTSLMESIDTALFENNSFELSYKDPNQKWVIREHLLKLLQEYPYFKASSDSFVQIDGTSMNLLNINGLLHVSDLLPEVSFIIWIHENYPFMPPMIYILSNIECPSYKNHSFIDQYGSVTLPYMQCWDPKRSNLCELIDNLIHVFQHDHPSMVSDSSKNVVMGDLIAKICDDLGALDVKNQHEIERLFNEQSKLQKEGENLDDIICYEEDKKDMLEKRIIELREYNGKLLDWIKKCEKVVSSMDNFVEVQTYAKKSQKYECLIEERALEDVIYALDKGLEQGVICLDEYMRQVRVLAREQFYHRAMRYKLKYRS